MWGCAGGGAGGERERVPRRIDGGKGMGWRRKAVEEATKRGGSGGREGCSLARGIGARRVEGARADGRAGERNGEETAAREAGRWDCRALF